MPGHCFINVGTRYESLRYDRPIKEDDPHCPIGIYGSTKYAAHILMSDIAKRYGVNYRTAVLFGVYGPMENINKFIPYVITTLLKGNPPQLTGCEQIRNYTYIDDIVGALLRLAEIDRDGLLTINIGSQTPMSLKEIVERIAQYIGSTINNIEFGSIPYRSDEIWKLVPDTHLCQDILSVVCKLRYMREYQELSSGIREISIIYKERLEGVEQ